MGSLKPERVCAQLMAYIASSILLVDFADSDRCIKYSAMLNWLAGKEGKECKFDHLHHELKAYLYFFSIVFAFDAIVYDGSNFNRSSRTGSKPLLASNFFH